MEPPSPRGITDELFAESLFEYWKTPTDEQTVNHSPTSAVVDRRKHECDACPNVNWSIHSHKFSIVEQLDDQTCGEIPRVSLQGTRLNLRKGFEFVLPSARSSNRCSQTESASNKKAFRLLGTPNGHQSSSKFKARLDIKTTRTSLQSISQTMPSQPRNCISTSSEPMCEDYCTTPPLVHQRSRAIPIKRRPQSSTPPPFDHDDDGSSNQDESEAMYDWSTWRLYHRIIEHREKYPLKTPYYSEVESSTIASMNGTVNSSRWRANDLGTSQRPSALAFESLPLEGEVFDFEL